MIHTLDGRCPHGYPIWRCPMHADPLSVDDLEEPEWHPVRSRRPLVLTLAALAAVLLARRTTR